MQSTRETLERDAEQKEGRGKIVAVLRILMPIWFTSTMACAFVAGYDSARATVACALLAVLAFAPSATNLGLRKVFPAEQRFVDTVMAAFIVVPWTILLLSIVVLASLKGHRVFFELILLWAAVTLIEYSRYQIRTESLTQEADDPV